ncbi:MAG: hypothetical protein GF308_15670 [Candidatus Heimdallarchaeota archaeon]|nr:hypothetical protein [Candidatus Heimdallarchaeota archaeon]
MTWVPTHITLETLLVWAGMGDKNREFFRERRGLFTLLTFTAILPDLDAFIYIHRTYFHSFVWPFALIIITLLWQAYVRFIRRKPFNEKEKTISRCLIVGSVFIILHIILDLNPGPVLIFYPFDTRMYSWNVSMVWDLDAWYLLHRIHFNWSSVSLTEGISQYFLNLTPLERLEYFGTEYIEIFINDFPIHLLAFFGWFLFLPGPLLLAAIRKHKKSDNFFKNFQKLHNPLLILGLLLLSFGLVLGPTFKLERVEQRTTTNWLDFSSEGGTYGFTQSYDLDRKDAIRTTSYFIENNSNCEIFMTISKSQQVVSLQNSLTSLFEQYENQTNGYTYDWLVLNYQTIVQDFLTKVPLASPLSYNFSQELSFTLKESESLYVTIILADWNTSINKFQAKLQTTTYLEIKRQFEFYFGLSLTIMGALLVVIPTGMLLYKFRQEFRLQSSSKFSDQKNEKEEKNGD